MRTKKIIGYGIMILLVITVLAAAAEAAWYNPFSWGGEEGKTAAKITKNVGKAVTKAECDKVKEEKQTYYEKYLEKDPETVRKLVEEDVKKCEDEAYQKLIEKQAGAFIGGGLRAVLGAVKGVLEGFIKETPLEKSKDIVIDRLKFKTDPEYKINSVRIRNEQLWNRACDELEEIHKAQGDEAYKCERPEKITPKKEKKKVITGPPKVKSDHLEFRRLLLKGKKRK